MKSNRLLCHGSRCYQRGPMRRDPGQYHRAIPLRTRRPYGHGPFEPIRRQPEAARPMHHPTIPGPRPRPDRDAPGRRRPGGHLRRDHRRRVRDHQRLHGAGSPRPDRRQHPVRVHRADRDDRSPRDRRCRPWSSNLPNQTGNGAITCLDVTADGSGDITALAYAASGQVSGLVTYDSVQDAYIVADRIFVPSSQLVSQPDLVPIIKVPYDAGQTLTVTFTDRHVQRQPDGRLDRVAGRAVPSRSTAAATSSSRAPRSRQPP